MNNALPQEILDQLSGSGLTTERAGELLGCGRRAAGEQLRKAGAVRSTHNSLWRIPNVARLIDSSRRWNNPTTASGRFEFTERAGCKPDKKSGHANRTAGKADG